MKIKNSVLVVLIVVLLILNIFFFVRYLIKKKQMAYRPDVKLTGLAVGEIAPAFTLKELQGKERSLDELKGKIALLLFCDIENEKSLLEAYYYKLLLGKYRDKGFVVWIVSNAKNETTTKDLDKAYAPVLILKDEAGKTTRKYCDKRIGKFQVFIVDRDGRIRFRDYDVPNLLARMMVEKYLPSEERTSGKDEFALGSNFPFLEYYDVKDDSARNLKSFVGKPILLTLFSANCPTCKEHGRLSVMRSAYEQYRSQGLEVILVYGRDNPPGIIKDYTGKAKLSFNVGVRKVESDKLEDYYQSYDLGVDPKSIIIDARGRVRFVENSKSSQETIQENLENLFKEVSK